MESRPVRTKKLSRFVKRNILVLGQISRQPLVNEGYSKKLILNFLSYQSYRYIFAFQFVSALSSGFFMKAGLGMAAGATGAFVGTPAEVTLGSL